MAVFFILSEAWNYIPDKESLIILWILESKLFCGEYRPDQIDRLIESAIRNFS